MTVIGVPPGHLRRRVNPSLETTSPFFVENEQVRQLRERVGQTSIGVDIDRRYNTNNHSSATIGNPENTTVAEIHYLYSLSITKQSSGAGASILIINVRESALGSLKWQMSVETPQNAVTHNQYIQLLEPIILRSSEVLQTEIGTNNHSYRVVFDTWRETNI